MNEKEKEKYFQKAVANYTDNEKLQLIIKSVVSLYSLHDLLAASKVIKEYWNLTPKEMKFIINLKKKMN